MNVLSHPGTASRGKRCGRRVKIVCRYCTKEFYVVPSQAKRKYCSIKCFTTSYTAAVRRRVECYCRRCGKHFTCRPAEARRRKYCSKKCADDAVTRKQNKQIAIAVLRGESYSLTGKRYGLCGQRVSRVVHEECRRADREFFDSLVDLPWYSNLKALRKHKRRFIKRIMRRSQP